MSIIINGVKIASGSGTKGDNGAISVTDSKINGNIKVDSTEIQVYDDTGVKDSIFALNNSKVDKVDGKSLIADTEITKLGAIADNATKVESSTTNGNININGTETTVYIHPGTGTNPHGTTKVDIELGNAENTSDLDKPISTATKNALNNKIDISQKGSANGVAQLDSNGFVPSSQLPSYVDDVINGTLSTFPTTGETGKIYVDTNTNLTYRWSGTAYVEISPSIALGETSSTAYAGDKGKATTDSLNTHKADTTSHITSTERTAWNNKFDKTGGSVTGDIEIDNSNAPQVRAKNTTTNNTVLIQPSSTAGEYVFGGNTDGSTSVPTMLRIGQNKLQYSYNNGAPFDIYHTGNKPSASDVGALPTTGGVVNGAFGILSGDVTDFNTRLTQGEYIVGSGATIPNAPITGQIYGKLIVTVSDGATHNNANNWIWQELYVTQTQTRYYRSKTNNLAWTDWVKMYNTVDKPTASDVGLGNLTNDKQMPLAYLDTTATLGTSDAKVPSQNAVKTYSDNSINNIKIGGRNLLLNSSFSSDTSKWWGSGIIDNGSLKLVGATNYVREEQDVNVLPSTQYTLSFDLVDQTDASSCSVYLWEHKADGTTTAVYVDNYAAFSTIGRNFYTRTTQPDCAKLYVLIQANNGKTIHVKNIKLEQGNKATDWTPAPEDVQSAIDYVQVGGRNYMSVYSLNQVIVSPSSNYNSYDFGHSLPEAYTGTGLKKYYTLSIVYVPTTGKTIPFSSIVLGQGTDGTAWGNRIWAGNGVIKKYDSTRYRWTGTFLIDGTTSAYLYNYIKIICESTDSAGCTINYLQLEEGTRGTSIKIPQEQLVTTTNALSTLQTPILQNSWSNLSSARSQAGYYKDVSGVVHLQGTIQSGASDTVVFTLPAGYRPLSMYMFACIAYPTGESNVPILCSCVVMNDGRVVISFPSTISYVSLDGISFLVGA